MFDTRSLRFALCLASALACVACSTTPSQKIASDDDDSYVPTGSHIPRKPSAGSGRDVSTINSQDAHDMMMKPAPATAIPGNGK
jgi:hypothetical protein